MSSIANNTDEIDETACDCCGAAAGEECDAHCDCTDCQREHDTEEEED